MQIRQDLIFTGVNRPSSFDNFEILDGDLGVAVTLLIQAPINRSIGELLGIGYLIIGEDTPVQSFKGHDCDLIFHDLTMRIGVAGESMEVFPNKVYAFKASRASEARVKIEFKADYSGSVDEFYRLLGLLLGHGSGELYEVRLSPRQKEMFDDGTQVDMTGILPPSLPLGPFLRGLPIEEESPAEDDPLAVQTLASVVDMVDPEKRKRGRPRKDAQL